MANKESLIIELDATTQKLDAKLDKTSTGLDKLDGKVKKTDKSFSNFSKSAAAAAVSVGIMAAATTAAVRQASEFSKQLIIASARADESVEGMQSLAFAVGTVGLSLEKIGDIAKDTNERIGEFVKNGEGGFQDFADVMGYTSIQAKAAADEFQYLSGPDVLQEMVSRMESAGASTREMSWALEGMASDTTDLIPLLTNGGESLKSLRSEFDSLNSTISQADLEKIKQVGIELEKAGSIFSASSTQMIADYSEEITTAINASVILGVKTMQTFDVITTGFGSLIDIAGAALNDFVNGASTLPEVIAERAAESAEALNELLGVEFYEVGKSASESFSKGFKDGDKRLEILIGGGKQLSAWEKLNSKERLSIQSSYLQAAMTLSGAFLEDNKAVNAGLVVADTAAGIMRAFATSSNIYEAYGHAAVVAATGLVQLSSVLSASKGGGSVSAPSSAGSSATTSTPDFEQETSSFDISDSTASGSQTVNFVLPDSDELGEAFAKWMNGATRQGLV